jgi:hypothetical protein
MTLSAGTGTVFHAPGFSVESEPVLISAPGRPATSAYTPTTNRVAEFVASRNTLTAWLVPEAAAVTMKASAAPALLLSTVGCTSIEPAREATTEAVVGTWQLLVVPGAGSEPKVAVVQASAPVTAF